MLRRGGKVRRQHEDIKSTNTEGGGRYHVTVLSAQSGGASRTGTGGRLQTGNMSAVPLRELCVVKGSSEYLSVGRGSKKKKTRNPPFLYCPV